MEQRADERETEFERLQAELDEVGNELAILTHEAEHLLEESRRNRVVAPSPSPLTDK